MHTEKEKRMKEMWKPHTIAARCASTSGFEFSQLCGSWRWRVDEKAGGEAFFLFCLWRWKLAWRYDGMTTWRNVAAGWLLKRNALDWAIGKLLVAQSAALLGAASSHPLRGLDERFARRWRRWTVRARIVRFCVGKKDSQTNELVVWVTCHWI